jgi:N-acyl-L-homoserine lactone synthetase
MKASGETFQAHIFRALDDETRTADVARFRKQLFVDTLKWNIEANSEREQDSFDRPDTVYAALYRNSRVIGTYRAIRSDHPYLAEIVFPELATTRTYPKRYDTWEISRFGILPSEARSGAANVLYALMFHFALIRRVNSLVAVTDLVHEKYLSRLGVKSRRFGKPQPYDLTDGNTVRQLVVGEIPIRRQDEAPIQSLLSTLNGVLIHDQTLVFGRRRVQA